MEEISKTFCEEGFDPRNFLGAAETYRWISGDTELGGEIVEHREKGKDIEDVCHWLVKVLRRVEELWDQISVSSLSSTISRFPKRKPIASSEDPGIIWRKQIKV